VPVEKNKKKKKKKAGMAETDQKARQIDHLSQ
jgi:hypothetical protein